MNKVLIFIYIKLIGPRKNTYFLCSFIYFIFKYSLLGGGNDYTLLNFFFKFIDKCKPALNKT